MCMLSGGTSLCVCCQVVPRCWMHMFNLIFAALCAGPMVFAFNEELNIILNESKNGLLKARYPHIVHFVTFNNTWHVFLSGGSHACKYVCMYVYCVYKT